jgi:hypothetical protein
MLHTVTPASLAILTTTKGASLERFLPLRCLMCRKTRGREIEMVSIAITTARLISSPAKRDKQVLKTTNF